MPDVYKLYSRSPIGLATFSVGISSLILMGLLNRVNFTNYIKVLEEVYKTLTTLVYH